MSYKIGDKVVLKKWSELPEEVKLFMTNESNEQYKKNFEGKTFTICTVSGDEDAPIYEFDEDEDIEENFENDKSNYFLLRYILKYIPTKKHHFAELFFSGKAKENICVDEHSNIDERQDFGWALRMLKQGKKVARRGWNGVGMWLKLQTPTSNSKMTLPYIYIEYPVNPKHHAYPNGSRCPWLASQTDLLQDDWIEIK